MFASKGSEGVAAKKALLAGFIGHPELLAQHLFPHPF
jgi:hypothetical protein